MMTPARVTYAAGLIRERNRIAGVMETDPQSATGYTAQVGREVQFHTLSSAIMQMGAFRAANAALQQVVDQVKADRLAAIDAELRELGVTL